MKILIIKLGALGDIIMSTSVIKKIQEAHADDEIYLLTSPSFEFLFNDFKSIKIKTFKRSGLINAIKSIYWIRQQSFSRLYDLQSNDRTSIYCALSGVPLRAGNHPRFPYHVHPEDEYHGQCHSFERLNQILTTSGLEPAKAIPYLPVSDDARQRVKTWLHEKGLVSSPYMIIHAGSSPTHIKKRWPYYNELAIQLSKKYQVVWIGSDDDAILNREHSQHAGIDATNQFSIIELVELGKRAKFAITNDSAPMHVLSCSNIPVFGLFGPTYARRTHALGQFDNVIAVDNIIANDDESFIPKDIKLISPDQVLGKLSAQGLI